jgi:DNA-binding transcriptional MerR regulator
MTESVAVADIPKRALFKPSEVCELARVQPYVLRTWEAEFPSLGVAKAPGAARVYRRADVEQVLRIKHLLLVEGLTLAGARRKLEEDAAPVAVDAPVLDELMGANARERLTTVKRSLQSLMDMLGQPAQASRPAMKANGKRHAPAPVRNKMVAKRSGGAKRRRA